ncbi:MAG: metallophosphoesterase [Planctomycetota bacterium]
MTSSSSLPRRSLLAGGAGLLAGGFVSTRAAAGDGSSSSGPRRTLRAAHLTDTHLFDERNAPAGVAAMFDHMAALPEAPELLLHTGDVVYDLAAEERTGAVAERQLELWRTAAKRSPAPIRYSLGNHDLWSGVGPTEAAPAEQAGPWLAAKAWGVPHPWYRFDAGGWRFLVLSSAWPNYGTLGEEQFEWLRAALAATPASMPICVLSHFPILSVTSLVYGDRCREGDKNVVPGSWQHADCWAITELFRERPNVKLCLSGHMHTRDRCEYRGIWYVCGGAASGSWWQGSEYGFVPSYATLDLFEDGTFDYAVVDFGWAARGWSGKRLGD